MKRVLPLIASASLVLGGCGGETSTFTSLDEVFDSVAADPEMTESRAFGIGVGIVKTCVESGESSRIVLPTGIKPLALDSLVVAEFNDGLTEGMELVDRNDPNVCEFADAPWNQ